MMACSFAAKCARAALIAASTRGAGEGACREEGAPQLLSAKAAAANTIVRIISPPPSVRANFERTAGSRQGANSAPETKSVLDGGDVR